MPSVRNPEEEEGSSSWPTNAASNTLCNDFGLLVCMRAWQEDGRRMMIKAEVGKERKREQSMIPREYSVHTKDTNTEDSAKTSTHHPSLAWSGQLLKYGILNICIHALIPRT